MLNTMERVGSYVNIFAAATEHFKACVTINKSLLRVKKKKKGVQFVVAGHEMLTRLH